MKVCTSDLYLARQNIDFHLSEAYTWFQSTPGVKEVGY